MRYPYGITVRIRRGGRDTFGDSKPATIISVEDCASWPPGTTSSSENTSNYADTVTDQLVLDIPAGVDLQADDQVLMPDEDDEAPGWEVIGESSPWRSPFTGEQPGQTVLLQRRT